MESARMATKYYICTCMRACVRACGWVYVYVRVCACACMRACVCVCRRVRASIYTCAFCIRHVCAEIHLRACMYTCLPISVFVLYMMYGRVIRLFCKYECDVGTRFALEKSRKKERKKAENGAGKSIGRMKDRKGVKNESNSSWVKNNF